MFFNIPGKTALAKLLKVAPCEIDSVISRRRALYRLKKLGKPDGGCRRLLVPSGKLMLLQDKVKRHILDAIPFPSCVHGGVRGRSIVSNARPHVQQPLVFSLDVKAFFPSVRPSRVFSIFQSLGFGNEAAELLMKTTTWEY